MACISCAAECAQQWSQNSPKNSVVGSPSPAGTINSLHSSQVRSLQGQQHLQGEVFAPVLPSSQPSAPPRQAGEELGGRSRPRSPEDTPVGLPSEGFSERVLEESSNHDPLSSNSEEDHSEAQTCKQRLYLLLEDPDSGTGARILSHCILLTIILSIAGFIFQTLPSLEDFVGWEVIEIGSTVIFTLEYVLRFYTCDAFGDQTRLAFVRVPMNILDILAILPFYVERCLESLELKAFRVLRAARLIRVFRIFKLSKYSLGMNLMVESLVNSVHPLSVLAFFLCIGVLLFSALLYYAERMGCPTVRAEDWQAYHAECLDSSSGWTRTGELCCDEHGSSMGFTSIRETFWWSIVTMTTVGYGDMVPRTAPGRLVAGLAMISGIILISLPVAIVGAKFQKAYEEFEMDKEALIIEERRAQQDMMRPTKSDSWKKLRKVLLIVKSKDTVAKGVAKEKRRSSRASRTSSNASLPSLEPIETLKPCQPSAGEQLPPAPARGGSAGLAGERLGQLAGRLRLLETRRAMSPAAQEQIQLLLELFEHVERAERQLTMLREKDAMLDACIRTDFAILSRRYDSFLAADLSGVG
mmetsp:Transcript_58552/g.171308  ORF Transcript_58552/g.171308 Transcript_58552/m.171308 type:complete len:583 (+) Transcript_58552:1-1749(+)